MRLQLPHPQQRYQDYDQVGREKAEGAGRGKDSGGYNGDARKSKGDLKLASRFIVTRMEDALGQAQRSGSDFLGIGVALRRQNNRAWRELRGRWPEVLREAEFEILSHVHIRGQGQVR